MGGPLHTAAGVGMSFLLVRLVGLLVGLPAQRADCSCGECRGPGSTRTLLQYYSISATLSEEISEISCTAAVVSSLMICRMSSLAIQPPASAEGKFSAPNSRFHHVIRV